MIEKPHQPDLAAYLIGEIQKQLPPHLELARSIEPILDISRSALYKRLRRASAFTAEELVALARHFQISLDHFVLDKPGTVSMDFPSMAQPMPSAKAFLAGIDQRLAFALQVPQLKLFYASAEIPLFCYLKYPELTAFKLYIWSRTTWLLPAFQNKKFSLVEFPEMEEVQQLAQSVLARYCQIESCEFWSLNMLENTLNQIDFLVYEGGFAEKGMAHLLCEQIQELLHWQQEMAEQGRKMDHQGKAGAGLLLYHNEIAHTTNTFLLQAPNFRQAFFTFDNPNYGGSDSLFFCDYAEDWFSRLQRCSTRMSQEGEKQRFRFFEKLQARMRKKIEEFPLE